LQLYLFFYNFNKIFGFFFQVVIVDENASHTDNLSAGSNLQDLLYLLRPSNAARPSWLQIKYVLYEMHV